MSDLKIRLDQLKVVAGEWDVLGPLRHRLISSGLDTSFDRILSPYILKSMPRRNVGRLFDGGCGTGDLTSRLASHSDHIDAVDISEKSIEIAKEDNAASNISYHCTSIETFARGHANLYDASVANMLLMDTPDALRVLTSIRSMLKPGGVLTLTILHPFFYDFVQDNHGHLGHYLDSRYSLDQFSITNYKDGVVLRSHFHRPVSFYVKTLCRLGYTIRSLDELAPPKSLSRQYGEFGRYPRFLGISARTNPAGK